MNRSPSKDDDKSNNNEADDVKSNNNQADNDSLISLDSGQGSSNNVNCSHQIAAILVNDLFLGYNQKSSVLNGVNMNVSPASIYGLLGKKR